MKQKRRVRKTLRNKYDLSANSAYFAWFPDQKPISREDFAIIRTPPQSNIEIEEVESIIGSFRPTRLPSQGAVKDLFWKTGWKKNYKFFPEQVLE